MIRDQAYERARRTVDFIKRYVFPGGCLPSVGALVDAAARASDLRLVHLGGADALTTPRRCGAGAGASSRIANASAPSASASAALRLWEFYLAYCEAGFEERHIGLVQLVFERGVPGAPDPRRAASQRVAPLRGALAA